MMKIRRVLPLCVLSLFLFAGLAQANSILDPSITLTGGGGSTHLFSTSWSFVSVTGTDPLGANVFINNSSVLFHTLTITVNPPTGGFGSLLFTCGLGQNPPFFFSNCSVTGGGNNPVVFTFFGGSGIPTVGGDFDISVAGWAPNTTFNNQANVPEPATITLLLVGLGGMAFRRRFKA